MFVWRYFIYLSINVIDRRQHNQTFMIENKKNSIDWRNLFMIINRGAMAIKFILFFLFENFIFSLSEIKVIEILFLSLIFIWNNEFSCSQAADVWLNQNK